VLGQATSNLDSLDGMGSGEATTFPHILFFVFLHHTRIQMAFIPRTPKEESRDCLGLDSQDFGSS